MLIGVGVIASQRLRSPAGQGASAAVEVLDNDVKVAENSELNYYLKIKYDGVDKNGVQSSDSNIAQIASDYITVADKIPDGLTFVEFIGTDDGSIGAVQRGDKTKACSGRVIDGVDGLSYNASTRTVNFTVEKLQAGCELVVGIKTRTPSLAAGETRRDFYNFASVTEGVLSKNSNTVHAYIGSESATLYNVSYRYTGTVPAGAPTVPTTTQYASGITVGVAGVPNVPGYSFNGWTTSDVSVNDANKNFTMPTKNVEFVGSFTKIPESQKYSVTYTIVGEKPEDYVAPKTKSYEEGASVALDTLEPGTIIDGYRFLGWESTDATLTETGFIMPNKNVVIKGKFEKIKYRVCYEFEGAIIPPNANSLLPACASYAPGETVTTAGNPTATGYEFLGWYKAAEFEMPEHDVVIQGEWMVKAGEFAPTITKTVVGNTTGYREGDTVNFEITVKNTASFKIHDILLEEKLDGAKFVANPSANSAYTVKADQFVLIPELAAGASVKVKASYTITENSAKNYTNTVKLVGALADNNYLLDETKDYIATTTFQTVLKQYSYVTISKQVKGDVADPNEYFKFTLKVSGQGVAGEKYTVSGTSTSNVKYKGTNVTNPTTCTFNTNCIIYLKHNQTVTIGKNNNTSQILVGANWTVSEEALNNYITTVNSNNTNSFTSTVVLATASDYNTKSKAAFINTKNISPATGIISKATPYIFVMFGAGLGLAALLVASKRNVKLMALKRQARGGLAQNFIKKAGQAQEVASLEQGAGKANFIKFANAYKPSNKLVSSNKRKLAKALATYKSSNKRKLAKVLATASFVFGFVTAAIVVMQPGFAAVKAGTTQPLRSVEILSEHTNYNNNEDGAFKINKSAEWIGLGKARVKFEIDSIAKTSGNKMDVIFVLDRSGSMSGDKLARVKQDAAELTNSLFSKAGNRAAVISFESGSVINTGITTSKNTVLDAIDGLTTTGATNYYRALVNADQILSSYTKEADRDVVLLFLTDGYPNVETPNQIAQYEYLKTTYPWLTVNGIQYEMGTDVLRPIVEISDNQFIADMESLNNVLFEASTVPYIYDDFVLTDYIDDDYFEIDMSSKPKASKGSVTVDTSINPPKVTWDLSGVYRSGSKATLTIDLKRKNTNNYNSLVSTNKGEDITSSLEDTPSENINSTKTPILKEDVKVIYDGNKPNDCSPQGVPAQETHKALEKVAISETVPTCSGYNFKGWEITTDGVTMLNDDYFKMPDEDVTIRATWTKVDVVKSMEGEIQEDNSGIWGITTMQEMTSQVCSKTPTPTTSARELATEFTLDTGKVPTNTLLDTRDNKSYTVSKLADGNCWMTQNLDLGDNSTEANPLVLTPQDSNVSQNFTMPAAQSGNDYGANFKWNEGPDNYNYSNPTNAKHFYDFTGHSTHDAKATTYGNLYNWYTATAGTGLATMGSGEEANQSICPKGWQLPQNTGTKSYNNLLFTTYGLSSNSASSTTMQNVPFSFPFSGYYSYNFGSLRNQGSYGNFWSSTASSTDSARYLDIGSSYISPQNYSVRANGLSVRCVAQ
ncbi:VWA domain-containing protein [Candidatus Saccharibacteria bacterium]|nr:VWA domain-containing protein [Candidatus Saccharibacteria bacterium]